MFTRLASKPGCLEGTQGSLNLEPKRPKSTRKSTRSLFVSVSSWLWCLACSTPKDCLWQPSSAVSGHRGPCFAWAMHLAQWAEALEAKDTTCNVQIQVQRRQCTAMHCNLNFVHKVPQQRSLFRFQRLLLKPELETFQPPILLLPLLLLFLPS